MKNKKGPVKTILILAANPISEIPLRLEEEAREIEEGLKRSECRDQYKIIKKGALQLRDFRRALLEIKPQIVHFTGHGEKSKLYLEDVLGFAACLSPNALSELFSLCSDGIECVILSACYSIDHAEAINKHIRYVIGMHKNIKDRAAIEFAIGFYDALGAGKSVESAFKFGKNAIQQYFPDSPEYTIPILKTNRIIPKKKYGKIGLVVPASEKRDSIFFRPVFVAVLILAIITLVWLWKMKLDNRNVNVTINLEAEKLTSTAREAVKENPTIALKLAQKSFHLNKNKPAKKLMQKIYQENKFYKITARQDEGVTSLAVSNQNKFLTGSPGGAVRLWDHKGKMLNVLTGHYGWIWTVVFSPDGRWILSSANDGTARLWDQEGHLKKEFVGHDEPVEAAAFSPNGQLILTGSTDNTAKLWNIEGNQLYTFAGHYKSITSVSFSTDGRYLLTGSLDESVRVWDLSSKEMVVSIETGYSVHSAVFSPDGKQIVTGMDDGLAGIWDINGNEILIFYAHQDDVYSVTFSPEGKFILTGSKDKTAKLWSQDGDELHVFKGHEDSVYSAVFSAGGQQILTGSFDQTVRIWEMDATLEELLKNNKIGPLTDEQKQKYGLKK